MDVATPLAYKSQLEMMTLCSCGSISESLIYK